ncbi:MAG: LysE family transporter [Alphaproteobacteria bacterium]
MSVELYLAFCTAFVLLLVIPGPNVAVVVANSVAYGIRCGLATAAGTSISIVAQLAMVGFGMTAVLVVLVDWFEWLRWAGVAYLVYAGWQQWRAPAVDLDAPAVKLPLGRMLRRGLVVSIANPNTLLFYAAFLPQFVDPAGDIGQQLATLVVTGLVLAIVVDGGWALLAGWLRPALIRFGRMTNRVTGGLLIGAGVGLALARRP